MANPNFGTFKPPRALLPTRRRSMSVCAPIWWRVYNYMASGLALSGHRGLRPVQLGRGWPACSSRSRRGPRRRPETSWAGVAIFAPLGLLLLTSFRAAQMERDRGAGSLLGPSRH